MDDWFVGLVLNRRVRFMAKLQLLRGRFLAWALVHLGAFPACRGHRGEEAIHRPEHPAQRRRARHISGGGRLRSGRLGISPRPGIGRLHWHPGRW
jgi:1-acyl-sn-glycerol-3-phosphate acyltransferase